RLLGVAVAGADGAFLLRPDAALADGTYRLVARAVDAAGNGSADGPATAITIDATAPAAPTLSLRPEDDSGVAGDLTTAAARPRLVGTAEPGARLELRDVETKTLIASTTVGVDGAFTFAFDKPLDMGRHVLSVRAIDSAGNQGGAG